MHDVRAAYAKQGTHARRHDGLRTLIAASGANPELNATGAIWEPAPKGLDAGASAPPGVPKGLGEALGLAKEKPAAEEAASKGG